MFHQLQRLLFLNESKERERESNLMKIQGTESLRGPKDGLERRAQWCWEQTVLFTVLSNGNFTLVESLVFCFVPMTQLYIFYMVIIIKTDY